MRLLAILAVLMLAGCAAPGVKVSHRLDFNDGVCSGTAVGRHTILSATHCFIGSKTLAVDGVPVSIVQLINDGNDHALAVVTMTFDAIAPIHAGTYSGQHVHYWGQPAALHTIYREGYVAGYVVDSGKQLALLDINGFGGDSGAGVFDADGSIVGVVSVIYQTSQGGYLKFMGLYPLKFAAKQWAKIR